MIRSASNPTRWLLALLGGLAVAMAPSVATLAQEPPEGPPACTEPADPNQGPPSNPPEDTPLPADPADPGDCPDDDGTARGANTSDSADGDAGSESSAQVAGVVETADGETPDELARTGSPIALTVLIGAGALVLGASTLAVRRRWA